MYHARNTLHVLRLYQVHYEVSSLQIIHLDSLPSYCVSGEETPGGATAAEDDASVPVSVSVCIRTVPHA